MLIAFYFPFLSIYICIIFPSFNGLSCQSLQCKTKTARKNGRPSRQSQRCQQGNAIGMQSAQLPWQKGCRLTCLRKTFLPFGREGAGKGSSRQEGNKSLPEKGKLKQKRHHSLRRWLVQDVGVGTANRLGRCEAGGVVCWGQAPEHGSCVFSLQGHRQGLKQLLNALGRRQPDASSMQRPKFFPSGRSGGAPPTTASFNHKRHELEALAVAVLLRVLMGSLSPFVVGGSRPTTRSGGGKH